MLAGDGLKPSRFGKRIHFDGARRCPNPMPGPSELEIRPVWESEDFGPEIAEKENAIRAELIKNIS